MMSAHDIGNSILVGIMFFSVDFKDLRQVVRRPARYGMPKQLDYFIQSKRKNG